MNEWEDNISFCSFCSSCVLRETSMMVDYTQILKKKDCERKKFLYVFPITSPAAHYREREEVLCEK